MYVNKYKLLVTNTQACTHTHAHTHTHIQNAKSVEDKLLPLAGNQWQQLKLIQVKESSEENKNGQDKLCRQSVSTATKLKESCSLSVCLSLSQSSGSALLRISPSLGDEYSPGSR